PESLTQKDSWEQGDLLLLKQFRSPSGPPNRPLSTLSLRPEDQLTRDCKEFYERRLAATSKSSSSSSNISSVKENDEEAGPSSLCSSGYFSLPLEEDPLQSKISHLRKEFLSLIEVDNSLFKQLLNLNDAIMDFKELHNLRGPHGLDEDLYEEEEEGSSNGAAQKLEEERAKILRSKSFLEETKTFQRQRISFPATRRNRRGTSCSFEEEEDRMFYTLPSSKAAKKKVKQASQQTQQQQQQHPEDWRGSSSRSSASSSVSSYERRSWKRYSETNNSLDSGIHADSSGEASDHYSP
ncbi:Uncharacterized protein FKW44_023665, partial [Caligus rogercresseyi]